MKRIREMRKMLRGNAYREEREDDDVKRMRG